MLTKKRASYYGEITRIYKNYEYKNFINKRGMHANLSRTRFLFIPNKIELYLCTTRIKSVEQKTKYSKKISIRNCCIVIPCCVSFNLEQLLPSEYDSKFLNEDHAQIKSWAEIPYSSPRRQLTSLGYLGIRQEISLSICLQIASQWEVP